MQRLNYAWHLDAKSSRWGIIALPGDVKHYRSVVGRLMWLIPLRPDLNFATKELSRALQSPAEEDYAKMKHLTKYIAATRKYELIAKTSDYASTSRVTITAYVDSDWAGCKDSRKSTSGGVLHINGVYITIRELKQLLHYRPAKPNFMLSAAAHPKR